MRTFIACFLLLTFLNTVAQKLPHGMVFGKKPNAKGLVQADKLKAIMGKRTRLNITVAGRVTLVTKAKGGWFDVDAGNGNIITAKFKNAGVTLPRELKNRYIVMEGIAQKRSTPLARSGEESATNTKQMLFFEVKGLVVDK